MRRPRCTRGLPQAIRSYDWATASTLASCDEEREDIADSIARVQQMEEALASGDHTVALELSITKAERAKCMAAAA